MCSVWSAARKGCQGRGLSLSQWWPAAPSLSAIAAGALPTPESLDSSSSITSKPETFFSTLQKFRETNKEQCVYSPPE